MDQVRNPSIPTCQRETKQAYLPPRLIELGELRKLTAYDVNVRVP